MIYYMFCLMFLQCTDRLMEYLSYIPFTLTKKWFLWQWWWDSYCLAYGSIVKCWTCRGALKTLHLGWIHQCLTEIKSSCRHGGSWPIIIHIPVHKRKLMFYYSMHIYYSHFFSQIMSLFIVILSRYTFILVEFITASFTTAHCAWTISYEHQIYKT